jgi:hypothetical protein
VAFSFLQSTGSNSNLTTYTFSSENLGAADAGRYIIVGVTARNSTADRTLDSVTVGGVAATIVADIADGTSRASIAIAAVPTGTTGDVVVTYSGQQLRCRIGLWRATGIDPTPHDTETDGSDTVPSASLNVPAGGFAVAVAMENALTTATWVGLTEAWDAQNEITMTGAGDEFASAQTGLAISCTFAANTGNQAGAFASWGPAGGGDVTVALTGQSLTASAGTLTVSNAVPLSGSALAASAGTLTASNSVALSGSSVTAAAGTLSPSLAVALSGLAASLSAGTLTVSVGGDVSVALTGQSLAASAGTLTPSHSVPLSGSALAPAAGTLAPSLSAALSGSALAATAGTLAPEVAAALSGVGASSALGTLSPEFAVALEGLAASVTAGTLTATGGTPVQQVRMFIIRVPAADASVIRIPAADNSVLRIPVRLQ